MFKKILFIIFVSINSYNSIQAAEAGKTTRDVETQTDESALCALSTDKNISFEKTILSKFDFSSKYQALEDSKEIDDEQDSTLQGYTNSKKVKVSIKRYGLNKVYYVLLLDITKRDGTQESKSLLKCSYGKGKALILNNLIVFVDGANANDVYFMEIDTYKKTEVHFDNKIELKKISGNSCALILDNGQVHIYQFK